MLASDLLGLPVVDAHGTRHGEVRDVRARVNCDGGTPVLLVDGVIVGKRHHRLFGYQRSGEQGPAVLRGLFRWLNKDIRYATIDQLALVPGAEARLRVPWRTLPALWGSAR
jgi:hypothetical protein